MSTPKPGVTLPERTAELVAMMEAIDQCDEELDTLVVHVNRFRELQDLRTECFKKLKHIAYSVDLNRTDDFLPELYRIIKHRVQEELTKQVQNGHAEPSVLKAL